ncbi:MAG: hypothetical protein AUI33_11365 [Ignavibacteria bacterium 13_1_40CM_2_61_4]|nr:MAG: hypothetical protein AUI33_11365 [Ignavibacteria bacterium 13_1_40CM_2_61_4]
MISNPALPPADELTYLLVAPSGFTAPGGTFTVSAGAPPNTHNLTMSSASPGALSGTLTVATDDPDSASKPVLLSGMVLAHAEPSLDSLAVTHEGTVDFGAHDEGDFSDQLLCIHNTGYGPLQAKLELTNAVINGAAGRFSIVGGFQPAEIAGTSRCYAIHFDDQSAMPNTLYQATLDVSSSDEALPGVSPRPALTVTLEAQTLATNTRVGEALPDRLAFYPPLPNPFRNALTLRFDLPRESRVEVDLFDLSGRRLAGMPQEFRPAGRHEVRWSPSDESGLPIRAGMYFVRFRAGEFIQTRRIVLLP